MSVLSVLGGAGVGGGPFSVEKRVFLVGWSAAGGMMLVAADWEQDFTAVPSERDLGFLLFLLSRVEEFLIGVTAELILRKTKQRKSEDL